MMAEGSFLSCPRPHIQSIDSGWTETHGNASPDEAMPQKSNNHHNYEIEHYLRVLVSSYAARLRKAFSPGDFEQLFRLEEQQGLFDLPIESIQPLWIRCEQGTT